MPITQEELKQTLSYDPETGVFRWLIRPSQRVMVGDVCGKGTNFWGYRLAKIRRTTYPQHRLAWLYMTGEMPLDKVDHINGDHADNRWVNLRLADDHLNLQNQRKAHKTNKTGLLGVSPNYGGFIARIYTRGKKYNLGTFPSKEIAHAVYLKAKRYLHEGNTL